MAILIGWPLLTSSTVFKIGIIVYLPSLLVGLLDKQVFEFESKTGGEMRGHRDISCCTLLVLCVNSPSGTIKIIN